MHPVLAKLNRGLVVSCQPVDNGPMDAPPITAAMARAAQAGGAVGLRIEGKANLLAVRPETGLPIIGLIKQDLDGFDVRITPLLADITALADAGADIIAYDATDRARPFPTAALVRAIKAAGCLAMADCASIEDGQRARDEGADILGTTLSGYAYDIAPDDAGPDLDLVRKFNDLGGFVMAEGRLNSLERAKQAMAAGANSVTVGSAITRIEHITGWFAAAVARNGDPSARLPSGLAVDFGGSKIAAARLLHGEIQKQVAAKTDGDGDAPAQVRAITDLLDQLDVRDSDAIGVAVAGRVTGAGVWHPVNSATLAQFSSLALADILSARYNRNVRVLNDAVSTAVGEHLAGAGRRFDRVGFLTVSTGVGGGFVLDGTPLISNSGLAGHVGFTTSRLATDQCGSGRAKTVESIASGRAIARAAAAAGHPGFDAKAVFHAHLNGENWAKDIIHTSANAVAEVCANLKAMLDLDIVLLGGSIGLAPGYLASVDGFLKNEPALFQPRLELAALGLRGAFLGVLTTQTL